MVAVAILAGMMTMVAMIFATASKATSVAQNQTKLERLLQQAAEIIKRDLNANDPSTTNTQVRPVILAIHGSVAAAHESQLDKASGRSLITDPANPNHDLYRADVMMLTTLRDFDPYVYQLKGTGEQFKGEYKQVVYGHANLGKLQPNGAWLPGPSQRLLEVGAIPLTEWHLARRVVGVATGGNFLPPNMPAPWPLAGLAFTGAPGPNSAAFHTDVLGGGSSIGAIAASLPDAGWFIYDAAGDPVSYYLENDGDVFRSDGNTFYRLDYGFWWRWSGSQWERRDTRFGSAPRPHPDTTEGFPPAPELPQPGSPPSIDAFRKDPRNPVGWYWPEWFYRNSWDRTWLDPSPPAGLERRLASYFLPKCSGFKVEFTFDNPRELALVRDLDDTVQDLYGKTAASPYAANGLQPTDPALTAWADFNGDGNPDPAPAPQPIRWQPVPPGQTWVWSGRLGGTNTYDDLRDQTQPFRWPRAIRITIRAHEASGDGLGESIVRTILHAW